MCSAETVKKVEMQAIMILKESSRVLTLGKAMKYPLRVNISNINPASGCQYTGYSNTPFTYSQSWSQSTTWSVSDGFNWDVGKSFALNIGATIIKSFQQGGSWQVSIPLESVGQTWTQKRMVWQNQQQQSCVRRHYGSGGLQCDSWGPYIHGDIPNTQPYNLGISLGSDHVEC